MCWQGVLGCPSCIPPLWPIITQSLAVLNKATCCATARTAASGGGGGGQPRGNLNFFTDDTIGIKVSPVRQAAGCRPERAALLY